MSSKKLKVLLITNIITPNQLPFFIHVAEQEDIELHVCYLGRTGGIRKWQISESELKFPHIILPGFHLFIPSLDWGLHINIGLLWQYLSFRPNIVVNAGWDCPAQFVSIFYSKLFRCKRVLWSGTAGYRKISQKKWVKNIKSWFIKQFHSYLTYGSQAADYLVLHGANKECIAVGYNTVDLSLFMKESEICRQDGSLDKLREKFPEKMILYVGRFLEFKRVDLLLEGLSQMKETGWMCLLIGWGPTEEKLKQRIAKGDLKGRVEFLDFQPPEELAKYYSLCRAFVLPSMWEPWGLVVNEAMACKAPVVISKGAGSAHDLVEEGITGFSYEYNDTQELGRILDRLIKDDQLYENIRKKGFEKIKSFTPEFYANNLLRAIREL